MSVTTSMACHDCKSIIWIGQRDYIYTRNHDCMAAFTKFLYAHMGHQLEFVNEHNYANDYVGVPYGDWHPETE